MKCSVPSCPRQATAKGKCDTHRSRELYGKEPHMFRSDNLRSAMITGEDTRQLERILSHLPEKASR